MSLGDVQRQAQTATDPKVKALATQIANAPRLVHALFPVLRADGRGQLHKASLTVGVARYLLSAFPLFIGLAAKAINPKTLLAAVPAGSALKPRADLLLSGSRSGSTDAMWTPLAHKATGHITPDSLRRAAGLPGQA